MGHLSTFAISAAGMSLERARAEAAAVNLANANVAARPGEPTFPTLRAVARPVSPFSQHLLDTKAVNAAGALAPSANLLTVDASPRRVHEPGHPLADEKGFVSYPDIDAATEMVTLLDATRAYEANVAAMNTARSMAIKALEIGGNS